MKKTIPVEAQDSDWHRKPQFGSLYVMKGSKYIYISINYFKQRLRFPTDKEDNPQNWDYLCDFMAEVGQKIKNRTFCFAKTFYWLDAETKAHFTGLEGGNYKPEPEHVLFGDYAKEWMERKIPTFASVTKQRDYTEVLISRILPHFGTMPFAAITASVVDSFIDNLKRSNGSKKPLSTKRVKNLLVPMGKIWLAACNDYNWNLRSPFSGASEKVREMQDQEIHERERQAVMSDPEDTPCSTRDVFLLSEWLRLKAHVDPHYHLVLELLLRGMIGSELEAVLKKRVVEGKELHVSCAVVRAKDGQAHFKFKPKNWYRKRTIPLTAKLTAMIDQAAAVSTSDRVVSFVNQVSLPASAFLLTMKDGSPFNYDSFRKTVWDKAVKKAGLDGRVPYASRHTFVQWALLVGVHKNRLVDLMGHSTKTMIDDVYGQYRQGLVEERRAILDYLGDDFLLLEELRTTFPERYQQHMAIPGQIAKAPELAIAVGQSFGQSQGLCADNYMK